MLPVFVSSSPFFDWLRTRVGLRAKVLALRLHLLVLQRGNQKRPLQLWAFDRRHCVGSLLVHSAAEPDWWTFSMV